MRLAHRVENAPMRRVREFNTLKYNSIKEFLSDILSGNPVLDGELKGWYWDKSLNTLKYDNRVYGSSIFFDKGGMSLTSNGIHSYLIPTDVSSIEVELGLITIVLKGRGIIEMGNF